jgi:hypothetical protein
VKLENVGGKDFSSTTQMVMNQDLFKQHNYQSTLQHDTAKYKNSLDVTCMQKPARLLSAEASCHLYRLQHGLKGYRTIC